MVTDFNVNYFVVRCSCPVDTIAFLTEGFDNFELIEIMS